MRALFFKPIAYPLLLSHFILLFVSCALRVQVQLFSVYISHHALKTFGSHCFVWKACQMEPPWMAAPGLGVGDGCLLKTALKTWCWRWMLS